MGGGKYQPDPPLWDTATTESKSAMIVCFEWEHITIGPRKKRHIAKTMTQKKYSAGDVIVKAQKNFEAKGRHWYGYQKQFEVGKVSTPMIPEVPLVLGGTE